MGASEGKLILPLLSLLALTFPPFPYKRDKVIRESRKAYPCRGAV